MERYNPVDWSGNESGALTRFLKVLKRICQKKTRKTLLPEICLEFKVFPINT